MGLPQHLKSLRRNFQTPVFFSGLNGVRLFVFSELGRFLFVFEFRSKIETGGAEMGLDGPGVVVGARMRGELI